MAIKARKHTGKTFEEGVPSVGASQQSGPVVLTTEESARLLQSPAVPPKPLSPEVKQAIANYKHIKAERVR